MLDQELAKKPMNSIDAGFDEKVELASIRRVTQAMALFVAQWCGVERI